MQIAWPTRAEWTENRRGSLKPSSAREWIRGRVGVEDGRRVARCTGAEGTRTLDLLVANQALSQLSYGPGD